MVTAIINGKILTPGKTRFGVLLLEEGKIRGIEDSAPEGARILDAEGDYVSPGFIDMHTHGAGGADFMDGTVDAYLTAARMHAKHGTTLLYPTTLTSTNEALYESFDTYRKAKLDATNWPESSPRCSSPFWSSARRTNRSWRASNRDC